MPLRKTLQTALILTALIPPASAVAKCDAVQTLAAIHDGYRAILLEDGTARVRAAAKLYPLLAEIDRPKLATDLRVEVNQTRWNDVLDSAEKLAKDVISGLQISQASFAPHTNQADWIAGLIRKSPCFKTLGNTGQTVSWHDKRAQSSNASRPANTPQKKKTFSLMPTNPIRAFFLAFLSVLSAGLLARMLLNSRQIRVLRMNRLPRKHVQIEFDVAHQDVTGKAIKQWVTALDVSAGGMKLKVEEPMSQGTNLTLHLPWGEWAASVVWANAHYAGIMFDTMLSETELRRLSTKQENSP